MSFRFELPDIDDSYALADWFEVMILRTGKLQVSRAKLVDALVNLLGSSPQELDVPVTLLFSEIGRRRRIAGTSYPLIVENSVVRLDPNSNSEFYKFLLLISLDGPMRRTKKFKDIDLIFDDVVGEAVKSYFGPGTETIRFGWPPSNGRPKEFHRALEWLCERVGVPMGAGKPTSATKDGGLDVVAWKPFRDGRSAFGVVLVQSTVQLDWFPKAKDIIDNVWLGRIDTGRPTLTSLAVPFVIPKSFDKWDDLRRTIGIVFDRLRLAQVLEKCDAAAHTAMLIWSSKELAKYSL